MRADLHLLYSYPLAWMTDKPSHYPMPISTTNSHPHNTCHSQTTQYLCPCTPTTIHTWKWHDSNVMGIPWQPTTSHHYPGQMNAPAASLLHLPLPPPLQQLDTSITSIVPTTYTCCQLPQPFHHLDPLLPTISTPCYLPSPPSQSCPPPTPAAGCLNPFTTSIPCCLPPPPLINWTFHLHDPLLDTYQSLNTRWGL